MEDITPDKGTYRKVNHQQQHNVAAMTTELEQQRSYQSQSNQGKSKPCYISLLRPLIKLCQTPSAWLTEHTWLRGDWLSCCEFKPDTTAYFSYPIQCLLSKIKTWYSYREHFCNSRETKEENKEYKTYNYNLSFFFLVSSLILKEDWNTRIKGDFK